jgi:hypothetical protein
VPGSVEAEIADLEDVRCCVTPLVRRAALRHPDSRAAAPCLLGLPAHTVLSLRGAGREASTLPGISSDGGCTKWLAAGLVLRRSTALIPPSDSHIP